jgi:N-methylhydantoinase A
MLPIVAERTVAMHGPPEVPVRIASGTVNTRLIAASALLSDETIVGPVLIEGYSSTTWVPPGWSATRDVHGNVSLRRMAA